MDLMGYYDLRGEIWKFKNAVKNSSPRGSDRIDPEDSDFDSDLESGESPLGKEFNAIRSLKKSRRSQFLDSRYGTGSKSYLTEQNKSFQGLTPLFIHVNGESTPVQKKRTLLKKMTEPE